MCAVAVWYGVHTRSHTHRFGLVSWDSDSTWPHRVRFYLAEGKRLRMRQGWISIWQAAVDKHGRDVRQDRRRVLAPDGCAWTANGIMHDARLRKALPD